MKAAQDLFRLLLYPFPLVICRPVVRLLILIRHPGPQDLVVSIICPGGRCYRATSRDTGVSKIPVSGKFAGIHVSSVSSVSSVWSRLVVVVVGRLLVVVRRFFVARVLWPHRRLRKSMTSIDQCEMICRSSSIRRGLSSY